MKRSAEIVTAGGGRRGARSTNLPDSRVSIMILAVDLILTYTIPCDNIVRDKVLTERNRSDGNVCSTRVSIDARDFDFRSRVHYDDGMKYIN